MSLVERALKKLQESKQSIPPAIVPTVPVVSKMPDLQLQATREPAPVHDIVRESSKVEGPSKIVKVDRAALRGMNLLPPESMERQIASQYQQVKRPLIVSALGRGGSAMPNGNLIMLTSALPGEGKTFTSVNLALSMTLEKDIEIVLVDADVAKPHVSRIFGLQNEKGLLDLLADTDLHPDSVTFRTDVNGLSIIPAGRRVETATELLASARMEQVAQMLAAGSNQRVVLFDSPPLLLATESRALVPNIGQIVMVVRAEETAQKAVMDAIEVIGEGKSISLIFNQAHTPPSSGYYGYGTYGDSEPAGS
jgi:exopolysaccharide/PEP-CTERM locus tyrosine autokinase